MSQQQVDEIFSKFSFTDFDIRFFEKKYEQIKILAEEIDNYLPDSDQKTLSFRAFQLGLMHLGKAIGLRRFQESRKI